MPDWLVIILLGIIEGITEFIPISSTGHLLLAQEWLPRQSDLFNIVIQGAAVLAVLPLFRDRLRRVFCNPLVPENRDFILKVGAAFAITGVGGLILKHFHFKLPEEAAPVAWALLLGGLVFIAVEAFVKNRPRSEEITWTIVWVVGAGQLIAAVFPGASRSGSTIILALLCGMSRPAATEFSFLVGIPTMLAASGLELFGELRKGGAAHEDWGMLLLGCAVSAVVSFFAVKWLIRFVQTHTFNGFAYYRLALGAGMLLYFSL